MDMHKAEMFDKALDMLMGDMDDMEGKSALSHSMEDCPNPLECDQHDGEEGKDLTPDHDSRSLEIKVSGLPTLEGKQEGKEGAMNRAEEGLSTEEAEQLKKLLK